MISDEMRSQRDIVACLMYAWRSGSLFQEQSITKIVSVNPGYKVGTSKTQIRNVIAMSTKTLIFSVLSTEK
jgi:hypothetical protein